MTTNTLQLEATIPPTPLNDAHPGGFLIFSPASIAPLPSPSRPVRFEKQPLTTQGRLERLQQRGLIITPPCP